MALIPEDFLRGAAPTATVRRIDFATTTPPIAAFKNNFAAVIDNFMSASECTELLRLAEESTPDSSKWERAMINAGNGKQIMSVDTRKSGRIIWDSSEIAARLLDRLLPYMREFDIENVKNQPRVTGLGPARRGEVMHLSRLNERLRFLRYDGGDYFRPHWDGCYVTPDGKEKSLFTIHLYLNGEGEQDMNELMSEIERAEKRRLLFVQDGKMDLMDIQDDADKDEEVKSSEGPLLGGATSFMDSYKTKDAVRVFPKTGSVLIFQQRDLLHGGDDVFRGVKYTVRTDVMYTTQTK
ncbi:uncharacterized protein N7498_006303 [Penicillium cinerascens]|uniref:Prolyl 4-hydroxylase alpha subunit domain-containing protein n=1 Tax=Penicillium cinerascens TaxID=70096 RepID=A0A9W9MHZ2_9EURO|nr:uncharacterized protein N7498_006303 [Penicillium cinerascens]KAJ5201640.1 hypothetical protein N7498_006303 [Penicillium cinerascens]